MNGYIWPIIIVLIGYIWAVEERKFNQDDSEEFIVSVHYFNYFMLLKFKTV